MRENDAGQLWNGLVLVAVLVAAIWFVATWLWLPAQDPLPLDSAAQVESER